MSTHAKEPAGPYLDLNDGNQIPQLGFGVFQVPPPDTAEAVSLALDVGYRLIDTAAMYENEAGVGEAIRRSGLDRGHVFVTTKLANDAHGHDAALRAFDHSLEQLGLEYVDLYLIHWPIPQNDLYVDTWRALCELKKSGRARSIGVSNFLIEHLERIIDATGVVPAVNQIEVHPRDQERDLRRYLRDRQIVTEAYSPLGQGRELKDRTIVKIAESHDRSPAQTVLRWHIQLGNVVIPKSVTPDRIRENFQIFDFELSDSEMAAIQELDAHDRIAPDPHTFG